MNKYSVFSKAKEVYRDRLILLGCTSKKTYNTRLEAKYKTQEVYKCDYCPGFHRTAVARKLIGRINILRKARKNKERDNNRTEKEKMRDNAKKINDSLKGEKRKKR